MRYFSYNEPDDLGGGIVITKSEEDVRNEYYPFWHKKMCEKYGEKHVNDTYCFADCLDDWIVVNWAWEVKDDDTD